MYNEEISLGEAMEAVRDYLEDAADKVGAYSEDPDDLQDNEMGDDFYRPTRRRDRTMGSNNDGVSADLRAGDIEDEAKINIKESARLTIYEAFDQNRLSQDEANLLLESLYL